MPFEAQRAWDAANPEKRAIYYKTWYEKNKASHNEKVSEKAKAKRLEAKLAKAAEKARAEALAEIERKRDERAFNALAKKLGKKITQED